MNTSSDGCHANPSIFVDFNSSSCIETLPSDELPNKVELVIVNPALLSIGFRLPPFLIVRCADHLLLLKDHRHIGQFLIRGCNLVRLNWL